MPRCAGAGVWLLAAVAALTGCPTERLITLRACVVEGAAASAGLPADAVVRASEIWRQAGIAFIVSGGDPLPIHDPQPPGTHLDVPPYSAPGRLGDIRVDDDRGFGSDEAQQLVESCQDAWRGHGYPADPQPGFTVVFVRELVSTRGGYLSKKGYSTDLTVTFLQHGAPLCSGPPYSVDPGDVVGRWTIVETVDNQAPVPLEYVAVTLAHELGHDLLLGHGDGLDNDGNGRWDEYCDNAEATVIPPGAAADQKPLMSATVVDGYHISSLQAERAQAAAEALMAARLAN